MNFNYNDDDGYKYSENQTDANNNKNKVRQFFLALPKPLRRVVTLLVCFFIILVVSQVAQIIDNEIPFFKDTTPPHTHEYNNQGICSCGANINGEDELDYGQLEEDGTECAILCDWCNICPDKSHLHARKCTCASEGLKFESNKDGTCTVTDIGSCLDVDLVIPKMSPEGDIVTKVGNYAFDKLPIKSLKLPSTIIVIDHSAFEACTKLEEFTMPPELKEIEYFAFRSCTSLKTINFNAKIEDIAQHTFAGCTALKQLNFVDNACELYISCDVFEDCDSLTSVVFPMQVMLRLSFTGCDNLEEVIFKENADVSGFNECTKFKKIVFEKDVIMDSYLRDLPNLEEVQFLGKITCSHWHAVSNCPKLTTIHIANKGIEMEPRRVNLIDQCPNVKNIYFHGTQDQWEMLQFFEYDKDLKTAKVYFVD